MNVTMTEKGIPFPQAILSPLNEHWHDDVDEVLAADGADDSGARKEVGLQGELAGALSSRQKAQGVS